MTEAWYGDRDHLGHAYLFDGADSEGRREVVRAFAKYVLCDLGGAEEGRWEKGLVTDFIEVVEPRISIQRVREICAGIYSAPMESAYKVIVLAGIGEMQRAAQNALLKSLEEPPEYVVWMLTVDRISKLAPTIRSRCRRIRVARGEETREGFTEGLLPMLEAALIGDASAVFMNTALYEAAKQDIETVFDETADCLRVLLEWKLTGRKKKWWHSSAAAFAASIADCISVGKVIGAIEKTDEIRKVLSNNVNRRLALESLFLAVATMPGGMGGKDG